MLKARLFAAFALMWFCASAWAGGSTINPAVPAFGAAMSSTPIRNNFASAFSDVNNLIGQNNSVTAPASPVLGQLWLNTSAAPYVLNEWDGSAWVQQGALNPSTHLWSFAPNSTISWASISGTPTTLAGYGIANGVSSVGLAMPSIFTCGGSPITSSGTFSCVLNSQSAGLFLASPNGSSGAPTFRPIQVSDVPTLNQNTTGNAATATTAATAATAGNVTGVVTVANGGTGASTASNALTNLGAASSGANSSITSLSGLTTPLSVSQGGTASTTAAAAFNALSPMTTTGDLEYENATGTASRLAIGSSSQVLTVVSGKPAWTTQSAGIPVLNGYINGFTLSNDGTTPNSVLGVSSGYAADSTNVAMISGTAFTKSTAGAWTAGTGNNGMGTGLTIAASTWYHVFAIINGGSFDVYFDTSPTAANKPGGTTAFRYVGSFKTDGSSHILAFTQYGQKFLWTATPTDLSGGTASSPTAVTISTPPGYVTFPIFQLYVAVVSGAANSYISLGPSSTVIDSVYSPGSSLTGTPILTTTSTTNTSSQVFYSTTGPAVSLHTIGYINPRVAPNL